MNVILQTLIFLSISCQGQVSTFSPLPNAKGEIISDTSTVPKDSAVSYFPVKSFSDTTEGVGLDSFLVAWYSRQLFALKEPIIYHDKSPNEIYRFTWLRTFHNPVAMRIEKHDEKYILYWKVSNGAGGYEPGDLTIDNHKIIDKETWQEFISKLNQTNFWNLISKEENFGLDGSEWILEGKTENKYHVVDRWSPSKNSKYYQCCDFLLGLADLKISRRKKY